MSSSKMSMLAYIPGVTKVHQAAPKGKSYDKAYQDQKPSGYYKAPGMYTGIGAKPTSLGTIPYYDIPKPAAAPPKPEPKPQPKTKPQPIKHSPEIQQAKDQVNAFEGDQTSPWEQAQANVQSSFINSFSSDTGSKEYDFSSNSFNPNESSEPNEQAQAAQNQLQNYISKYSNFKSSSN